MDRGTLLAGRYQVSKRLGRGGMGEVWSARDRVLRRDVAIKLLRMGEDASADLLARFEREAVAAAQINHPNVVALHDRGVHEGVLFLVMELVDGVSLSALIEASGTVPLSRALEIAEQICAALEATHAAGVVHFDIKPHNVMIAAAGLAKVVDFGIAGLARAQQLSVADSSRLEMVATREYAAPEQFTAERGDARSDLYALGGVLFAMLTGRAPFDGYSPWAMVAAKISGDAPRLDRVRPGLPPAFTALVACMLEREPELRPQSAREVRERLARLRADPAVGEEEHYLGTTVVEAGLTQVPAPVGMARPSPVGGRVAGGGGPRQPPTDTGLFTGREDELQALFALAEQARTSGEPGTVVISAIDGMGGVGKTALAVRAAHRLASRFPDGQLFLDLYGFTQGAVPRDPGDALAALLAALGIPPQQIPAELGARAAFYRDRLAGTRTLIVLDNAVDEAQVAPLLPASESCLVLVTSRKRFKALDDALPLPLDVLAPGEAVTLLRKAARLGEDPGNEALLEQAAELCGRLPLALLIAGALLRTGGKAWNLSVLIERLTVRPSGHELAGFTDDTRSVQAVFDLSYQHLPEDLRRLFRLIGLLPGPEFDAYAAAALLESDPETAGRSLQRLVDHSLLTSISPGRYRPHDLIRAHARTLAALDPEPERQAALDRLLHYYAHTAQRASQPIARFPRTAPTGPAPAFAPALTDPDAAHTWLRIEHPDLDAAFTHAHTHGLVGHTITLAAGLAEILLTDGPWTRAFEVHQTAADSAEQAGLPADHASSLTELGRVRYTTGDYPGADDALTRALEIFSALGNPLGEANALAELGRVKYVTGDYPGADDALTKALEIHRALGNRLGQANALAELGRVRHVAGDFPGAEDDLTRALEIFRDLGNRLGQANALNNLGQVRSLGGDYPGAIEALTGALEIFRVLGNRLGEATALNGLGRARMSTGDYLGAGEAFTEALEICRVLGFRLGVAYVLSEAGRLRERTGDNAGAGEAHTGALKIFRTIGDRLGEANALTDLGRVRSLTEDNPGASEALTHALEIYREIGDQGNEAWALNHYAAAVAQSGDRPRALTLYQQALAMSRELNKPDDEAVSLEGIAEYYVATGDTVQGAVYLKQAWEIYQRLGMRADVERVQARLDGAEGRRGCRPCVATSPSRAARPSRSHSRSPSSASRCLRSPSTGGAAASSGSRRDGAAGCAAPRSWRASAPSPSVSSPLWGSRPWGSRVGWSAACPVLSF